MSSNSNTGWTIYANLWSYLERKCSILVYILTTPPGDIVNSDDELEALYKQICQEQRLLDELYENAIVPLTPVENNSECVILLRVAAYRTRVLLLRARTGLEFLRKQQKIPPGDACTSYTNRYNIETVIAYLDYMLMPPKDLYHDPATGLEIAADIPHAITIYSLAAHSLLSAGHTIPRDTSAEFVTIDSTTNALVRYIVRLSTYIVLPFSLSGRMRPTLVDDPFAKNIIYDDRLSPTDNLLAPGADSRDRLYVNTQQPILAHARCCVFCKLDNIHIGLVDPIEQYRKTTCKCVFVSRQQTYNESPISLQLSIARSTIHSRCLLYCGHHAVRGRCHRGVNGPCQRHADCAMAAIRLYEQIYSSLSLLSS